MNAGAALRDSRPYLARPLPRALIIGSFVLVGLPLAAYLLTASAKAPIVQLYFVAFGMTHFFLTFAVFLSSANVRHFRSSPRNVFAFLIAPAVPLVGLATWYGFGLSARFLVVNTIVFATIRAFDFYHLSRQSFGVLQLFKGKSLKAVPAWTRKAENLFFLSLTALMFNTFMTNLKLDVSSPLTWALGGLAIVLLCAVLTGYVIALRAGADRKEAGIALLYLAIQTGSALLAVYRTTLYMASLAVHYVEYHVIMAPRVFKAPIEPGDRVMARVRRTPVLLYGGLLASGALYWVMLRSQGTLATGPVGPRLLVHVFDGIFVFHYIIEMSIWKFSDPYFRKSLGPLYVG